MKKLVPIFLAMIIVISGCTQSTQPEQRTKYKYLEIDFEEPTGWEKSYPFKGTLADGQVVGPDDVLFTKNNLAIMVTSGGSLDELSEKAKGKATFEIEDKTIGKLYGKKFSIKTQEEGGFYLDGFTFERNNVKYFITIFSNETLTEESSRIFNKLIESVN